MIFEDLDGEKAFCTLTVNEISTLFSRILDIKLYKFESLLERSETRVDKDNDYIDCKEVARMTGYKVSTVYSKVSRREIPALSRNKPLTFSRKGINNWLELGKPNACNLFGQQLYN